MPLHACSGVDAKVTPATETLFRDKMLELMNIDYTGRPGGPYPCGISALFVQPDPDSKRPNVVVTIGHDKTTQPMATADIPFFLYNTPGDTCNTTPAGGGDPVNIVVELPVSVNQTIPPIGYQALQCDLATKTCKLLPYVADRTGAIDCRGLAFMNPFNFPSSSTRYTLES